MSQHRTPLCAGIQVARLEQGLVIKDATARGLGTALEAARRAQDAAQERQDRLSQALDSAREEAGATRRRLEQERAGHGPDTMAWP